MAASDDPKTFGRTRLSFADENDIDEFVATLEKFEKGELTADQWRAFRLVRGTYGQRQTDDSSMLRVKVPQGMLTSDQLDALADVGDLYSRGFGHITTRQNIQFHFVKLHDVELSMRLLADKGITTREACGNSVRNITCCPYAGVSREELFDPTPYSEAMTRYLLRHPLSASLPRKFKIAFEGCISDHALTAINDLGFRAAGRVVNGKPQRGFRVTAAGGTAILCRTGEALYDFCPAGEIFEVAEAIIRVFHKRGDRAHKQRNRMKFLVREMGWDGFKAEFEKELAAFRAEGGAKLPFDPESPSVEQAPIDARWSPPTVEDVAERASGAKVKGPGIVPDAVKPRVGTAAEFASWRKTNVQAQKQPGFSIVSVTLPLGDFTGQQMRILSELARAYSDGACRITPNQDLMLRWVKDVDVPELYARLVAAGLGLGGAHTLADVTSCPGAESCKLAVTQSRGLGKLLGDFLQARPDLVAIAPDVQIKMSGCPNGCGQHHIAGIGFQGSVRKVGDKPVPQYFVMLGGGIDDRGARFGRIAAKIPARRIPTAVERLLGLYQSDRREGETATAFFARVDLSRVKTTLGDLEDLRPDTAKPEDFVDLGETAEFKPEMQDGECAA